MISNPPFVCPPLPTLIALVPQPPRWKPLPPRLAASTPRASQSGQQQQQPATHLPSNVPRALRLTAQASLTVHKPTEGIRVVVVRKLLSGTGSPKAINHPTTAGIRGPGPRVRGSAAHGQAQSPRLYPLFHPPRIRGTPSRPAKSTPPRNSPKTFGSGQLYTRPLLSRIHGMESLGRYGKKKNVGGKGFHRRRPLSKRRGKNRHHGRIRRVSQ